jgi:hypothetical protein
MALDNLIANTSHPPKRRSFLQYDDPTTTAAVNRFQQPPLQIDWDPVYVLDGHLTPGTTSAVSYVVFR